MRKINAIILGAFSNVDATRHCTVQVATAMRARQRARDKRHQGPKAEVELQRASFGLLPYASEEPHLRPRDDYDG